MWNAGPEPARMIEVISPAGFELFFRAVVHLLEAGDADPEQGAHAAVEQDGTVRAQQRREPVHRPSPSR